MRKRFSTICSIRILVFLDERSISVVYRCVCIVGLMEIFRCVQSTCSHAKYSYAHLYGSILLFLSESNEFDVFYLQSHQGINPCAVFSEYKEDRQQITTSVQ